MIEGEKNVGLATGRVLLINNSNSEYVVFVDSDDYLLSENFDCVLSKIDDIGDFDILFFSNSEKSVSKKMIIDNNMKSLIQQSKDNQLFLCFGIVWGKIYNKKYIGNVRFNEKLKYCEDVLFNGNLRRENSHFVGIGIQAIIHENNAESLCHKYNPKADEMFAEAIIELEKMPLEDYSNLYRECIFEYYFKHILPLKVFNSNNKKSIVLKNREACEILFKEPFLHVFRQIDYKKLTLKRKVVYRLAQMKLICIGYYLM
jgi:glycosyltransferase involved in cell wall biosynthesis